MTIEDTARSFSDHHFEAAAPQLADDLVWTIVGEAPIVGKDAVIAACESSAEYLEKVTVEFRRFRTVVGEGSVVVDSLADYTDADGALTTVASCDIYDFTVDRVTGILSYNIEVSAPASGS